MTDPRLRLAAEWKLRLEKKEAANEAVKAWRRDAENDEAWQAVQQTEDEARALANHPDMLGLRLEALAYVMRERQRPPLWQKLAAAAAVCVAVGTPVALSWWPRQPERPPLVAYNTDRGQRMLVALPDGSHLTLDTASRVRLAYSNTERRLILEQGQALFEVAKHQSRPFVVVAGSQEVVAHGTKFDVRLDKTAFHVALVEGKVSVASGQSGGIDMRPDDVLTIKDNRSTLEHVPGSAASLASWSNGDLNFADARLVDIAAEMNRYGPGSITVADVATGNLRISGSFRIGEIAPFLEVLKLGYPVQITGEGTANVVVAMRHD